MTLSGEKRCKYPIAHKQHPQQRLNFIRICVEKLELTTEFAKKKDCNKEKSEEKENLKFINKY